MNSVSDFTAKDYDYIQKAIELILDLYQKHELPLLLGEESMEGLQATLEKVKRKRSNTEL